MFGRDLWIAFGLTCVLMVLWDLTPLGVWIETLLGQLGDLLTHTPIGDVGRAFERELRAPLIVFAWPAVGIGFFWVVRILLWRLRRKRNLAPGPSPAPS